MKAKIATAAASALMLISAPAAFADENGSADPGDQPRAGNDYPTLPSECEPTADRTAIECTYDYGDRVDVQPAYGCWTLDDGSELCVDPPEIPNFVGCDYAAGECDIVVDPTTDRCVIAAYGPEIDPSIWLFRDGNLHIIEWNWGADPAADDALKQSWNEIVQLIAAGDVAGLAARCWPDAPGDGDPVDEPTPVDPIPVPYPGPDGRFEEGEISFDSPAALSGARAEKGNKQKKAKKKSRGKKSKPKKSSRR